MPTENKVIQFGKAQRCLDLHREGLPSAEIAEILTNEIRASGIRDSVSPSSVVRYLRAVKIEEQSQSKAILSQHIRANLGKDLEVLEEIEAFFVAIFRNIDPDSIREDAEQKPASYAIATRGAAGKSAADIIKLKLHYADALGDPDKEGAALKKADELLKELGEDLRGKVEDVIGTGESETAISGPH